MWVLKRSWLTVFPQSSQNLGPCLIRFFLILMPSWIANLCNFKLPFVVSVCPQISQINDLSAFLCHFICWWTALCEFKIVSHRAHFSINLNSSGHLWFNRSRWKINLSPHTWHTCRFVSSLCTSYKWRQSLRRFRHICEHSGHFTIGSARWPNMWLRNVVFRG